MGLIYKLGSLVGLVVGIWIASRLTASAAESIGVGALRMASIFFLILAAVRMVFGWAAYFVQKVFNIVAIIPGLKLMNRVLGAFLSTLSSLIVISTVLFIAHSFAATDTIQRTLDESLLGSQLLKVSIVAQPFFSDRLQTLFDSVDFGT